MAGFGEGGIDWGDDQSHTLASRQLTPPSMDYTDLTSLIENLEFVAQRNLPGDGDIISKGIFEIQLDQLVQVKDLAAFGEILSRAHSRTYQVAIKEGQLVCLIVLLTPHIDHLSGVHSVNPESYMAVLSKEKKGDTLPKEKSTLLDNTKNVKKGDKGSCVIL